MVPKKTKTETQYKKIITSKQSITELNLKQVWEYRDLIRMFIRRDIVTNYKQTVLGPLWFLLQPIISTIMYIIVFGNLAQLSTDGIPQVLFYFSGTMMWSFFSGTLTTESNVFNSNKGIFGKVYFPRLTVPIASAAGVLIKMLIQFVLFCAVYVYYIVKGVEVGLTWRVVLIPFIVLWMGIMAIGIGLIVSAITTKYHDIAMALGFFLSLFMYATPVVYPLSEVPEKYRILFNLNPVSAPMETFRIVCFDAGQVSVASIIESIIFTVVVLFGGVLLFNKSERTFVDVI